MVEPYQRAAELFPSELMGGVSAVMRKLTSADWTNPDRTAEEIFDEFAKYDLKAVYSKFMVNCLIYWLSPEEIRKNRFSAADEDQTDVKKRTERAFDVMWVAYERWVTRGANHYVEVASALTKFYSQLRWAMSLQQSDGELPSDIEKQIAEEAYHYLVHVQSLVEHSYSLFHDEMSPILEKLVEINPDITKTEVKP